MTDERVVDALRTLAQHTRFAVFRLLLGAGAEGLPAGAIAQQLGVRRNTLSTHLQALWVAGLVTRERVGRSIIYRAVHQDVSALLIYLINDTCGRASWALEAVRATINAESNALTR